jgi:hypothetical protein
MNRPCPVLEPIHYWAPTLRKTASGKKPQPKQLTAKTCHAVSKFTRPTRKQTRGHYFAHRNNLP